MRISDWSSDVCSSDLHPCPDEGARHPWRACRGPRPPGHGSPGRRHRRFDQSPESRGRAPRVLDLRLPRKKPRQRIADAASRPGDAESRPWMACGGESGMDACRAEGHPPRSEEHTSELQSLMRISYAVFCLNKKHVTEPSSIKHKMI